MRLVITCFLQCLLLHGISGDPMLHLPETTQLDIRYPSPLEVNCSAYIDGASVFTMGKDGRTAAVITITDENTIIDVIFPLFATKVSVDDSFASDNSPPRNITVTYFSAEPTHAEAGMYQCELGEDEFQYEVQLYGPPVNIMITSGGAIVERLLFFDMEEHPLVQTVYEVAVNVRDEGSVKLTATASGYSDSVVSWYKKEDGTDNWLETGQQDFIELEINTLESASYLVSAVNLHSSYNATVIVIAGYPPSLAYTEKSFRPVNGDGVSHTCVFNAAPPANVSYWKQNAETLEWEVIASAEESLSIPSVELERDVGIYQCVGTNIFGNYSATIYIRGDPANAWITVVETFSTFAVIDLYAQAPTDLNYNITMTTVEDSQTVKRTLVGKTTNRERNLIKQSVELERLQPESLYSLNGYVMNAFGSYQLQEKTFTTKAVPTTTDEPSTVSTAQPSTVTTTEPSTVTTTEPSTVKTTEPSTVTISTPSTVTSRVQTQPDANTSPSSTTTPTTSVRRSVATTRSQGQPDENPSTSSLSATSSRQDLTTSINQVQEQVNTVEGQDRPSQYASPSVLSSWVLMTFTTMFLII